MFSVDVAGQPASYLLLAIFLVLLNAFFVLSEFAIVKIRVTRIKILATKGNPVARLTEKIVGNLDPYLTACQLGITLASLGLGWIGEPAFAKILEQVLHWLQFDISATTLHSVAFTIAFLTISALHIILGELVPKSIAIRMAEKICLLIAVPLHSFYLLFLPLLWVFNGISNLILKCIRIPEATGFSKAHSEEELKLVVEDSFEHGNIGSRKKLLLDKAIDFANKTVRDIMVAQEHMICFYLAESVHENLARAKESGHTRFPLWDDGQKNIIGFVHIKDVIWALENGEVINLYDLCRPIPFFDDATRIDVALKDFQRDKQHIAIVRQQNKIVGLITLENIIEQLVGAIEDEFDDDNG